MTPLYEGQPGLSEMLPLLAERGFRPVSLEPILLDEEGMLMELDGAVRANTSHAVPAPGWPGEAQPLEVRPVAVGLPGQVQDDRNPERRLRGDGAVDGLGHGGRASVEGLVRGHVHGLPAPQRRAVVAEHRDALRPAADDVEALRRRSYWLASKRLNGGTNTSGRIPASPRRAAPESRSSSRRSRLRPASSARWRGRASRVRWSKPCCANVTESLPRRSSAASSRSDSGRLPLADGSR